MSTLLITTESVLALPTAIEPFLKTILQTRGQILGIHDSSEPTGAKGTNNPRGYAENNQKRNHCHQSYNFRKNKVSGGIDPHDFQCINLLGYTHGSYFGGNIRTYLS